MSSRTVFGTAPQLHWITTAAGLAVKLPFIPQFLVFDIW